jgi:Trypsin-like peptidase domain
VKRPWATIVVLLVLSAPAAAEWPSALWSGTSSTQRNPAVVRIMAPGKDSISYGSGSLVAKSQQHGLIVTNWHVVNEATGQIMVMFPDGCTSAGTVIKVDRDWDLAAIAIWRPNVEPLPLATVAPQLGETLTIAGYGSGNYRAASGRCTQYVAPGTSFPYEMVELAAAARQGDSGGPILNSRGELAGVLFGEGGGRTAGSYCGRVQWFLAGLAPNDSNLAPGTMLAGTGSSSSLAAQPTSNPRAVAAPANRLAAPAQPGARVGALAALGLPTAGQTSSATPPPPPAGSPTTTFASSAGPPPSPGWQSAPPRGLANPDRDPPAPRGRPSSSDGDLVEVPRVRGIPDTAAFNRPTQVASESPGAPAGSSLDDRQSLPISWTDIAGDTLGEQIKTILATIGGLAVFMQTLSWFSGESKPAKKKSDDEDADDDEDDDDD